MTKQRWRWNELNQKSRYQTISHALWVGVGFSVFYGAFFSSIVLTDRLLAETDALFYYLPGLFSPRTLWTPLLFAGFPAAADPQMQTWYPLSLLFSIFPRTGQAWNAYVMLAYVLASSFLYGYVYQLTRSKLAAIVAGLCYGLSGFMIGHIYHVTMIHAAAWMPLMVWSLEKLRERFDQIWFAIGTVAIANCFLSGHPQISVYGISVAIVYGVVIGWRRWKFYRSMIGMFGLGILLTGIQLLPTAEFSGLSLRADMTFESFVTFSLPLWQTFALIFPYVTNGNAPTSELPAAGLYGNAYWGSGGWAEVTGYMGIVPVMLAAIALFKSPKRRLVWVWIAVAGFGFLLALGDSTPFAWLVYHIVPAFNKFRAQARNFVEVHLAISILAGLGVAAAQQTKIPRRFGVRLFAIALNLVLITLLGLQFGAEFLQEKARALELELSLVPWENWAIAIPLLAFVVSSAGFLYWNYGRDSKVKGIAIVSQWVLILAVLIDLGSFAQFGYWRYLNVDPSILTITDTARSYRNQVSSTQQRLLTLADYQGNPREFAPNLTRLWKMPNASGYSPLTLSRIGQFVPITLLSPMPNGSDNLDRSLDLLAVRYLFLPSPSRNTRPGVAWSEVDLSLMVGDHPCAPNTPQTATFDLPKLSELPNHRDQISAIGIVSSLACSPDIPNLTSVATVSLTDQQGRTEAFDLKTGRDTAEWAADCVKVKHQKAPLFSSQTESGCKGHSYVTVLPLNKPMDSLKTLSFRWNSPQGQLAVRKVSLIDQTAHRSFPLLNSSRELDRTPKWRSIETIDTVTIYENRQAMPRAWIVPEVLTMPAESVFQTIKSGKISPERSFDPAQVALIERSLALKSPPLRKAVANVTRLADTQIVVETESSDRAFLVLSDVYYPGWQVSIDNRSARLFQTDYVLRGVAIPSGKHTVEFRFVPRSFHWGVGLSMAGLGGLGFVVVRKSAEV